MYTDLSNALADIAITVGGVELCGNKLGDQASKFPQDGDLPARIMQPVGNDVKNRTTVQFTTHGKLRILTWNVAELFLYKVATAGGPLGDVWAALSEYSDNYIYTMIALKHPTNSSTIAAIDPMAMTFEWPQNTGRYYHGVQMITTIEERVC